MFRNRRNSSDSLAIEGRGSPSAFTYLSVALRSLIFNALFFTTAPLLFLLSAPILLYPKPYFGFTNFVAKYVLWLLKIVCGLDYKIEGLENLPKNGCLIACKHQSSWETFVFFAFIPKVVYVIKKELEYIPIYGQYTKKLGMISIDRKDGRKSIVKLKNQAMSKVQENRQIVIFPEGSRTAVGEKRPYQKGIYLLYKSMNNYPVVPAALNSGQFWSRRGFLKWPGVITLKFLKPLPEGLDSEEFMSQLTQNIESASDALTR